VVLTLAGVGLALRQISAIEVKTVIGATGGVPRPEFVETTAVIVLCAVLSILAFRKRGAGSLARKRLPLLVLAAGVFFTGWLGGVQLLEAGKLSYYSLKFLIAFELVALVLAAVALAVLMSGRRRPRRSFAVPLAARVTGAAVSVLAAVAATQLFGAAPLPRVATPLGTSAAAKEVADQQEALRAVPPHVTALLRAVDQGGGEPAIYVTTEHWSIFHPLLAQQWYSALTGTYTEAGWRMSLLMVPLSQGPGAIDGVVESIRAEAPDTLFIINP
jgi:heme A synthase